MGPSVQLVRDRFSNFLLRKLSREFKLHGMSTLHEFHISVLLEDIVTRLGMLVVLQVLCRLIWPWPDPRSRSRSQNFWSSKNCQKLHFSTSISSTISAWSSKVMVDHDSTGPSLQLVGARFSNFLLRKLSCKFKLRRMSILHEFQTAIFPSCLRLRSHGRACW